MKIPLSRSRRTWRQLQFTVLSGFIAAPLWMTGTVLLLLGAAAAGVTYPLGYREMIDGIVHQDAGAAMLGGIATVAIFAAYWSLTIIGATQAVGLNDRVNAMLSARVGQLLALAPTLEHFERPDYLAEVDLLTQNRRALASSPRLAVTLVLTIAQSVVVAVLLAGIYPALALLPLASAFPLLGDDAAVRLQERTTRRTAERSRLADEIFGLLTTAANATELRICGLQDELTSRYLTLNRSVRRASLRTTWIGFACSAAGWSFYIGAYGAALIGLAVLAADGRASLGNVVMAAVLVQRAQNQAGGLSDSIGQMITNSRTARRLVWLETIALRPRTARGGAGLPQPPESLHHGIELDAVTFTYPGTDRVALRDVSLTLPVGKTIAVVGENGAGKTTLAKLLLRLYQPTQGRITVDGEQISGFDLDAWRRRCTAAFQDHVRFELKAGHIIGVGDLPRLDDEEATLAALTAVRGTELLEHLDQGLHTPIGRTFPQGRDLSGGQWQRLALARTAMPDNPILTVLDEPSASLDARAESALLTQLTELARTPSNAQGITVLITHRFTSARMADIIIVLDQGAVIEQGDHDTLIARNGRYAELYALQARAYLEADGLDHGRYQMTNVEE